MKKKKKCRKIRYLYAPYAWPSGNVYVVGNPLPPRKNFGRTSLAVHIVCLN